MDAATLQVYRERSEISAASGTHGANRWLPDFLALLPRPARILEPDCGGGVDAGATIAVGFDVDPVDGLAEIAAKAEARLGRSMRVRRFGELEAVEAFDAVWASASLLPVPRPDCRESREGSVR